MNRRALIAAVAALALGACKKHDARVKEAPVAEVAAGLEAKTLTAVDANDDEYRQVAGTLPGAVLLDNYRTYDVEKTLGSDKKKPFVFYCTSRT